MRRWPAGFADIAGVPLAIDDPNIITRFVMLNPFTPGGTTSTIAVTTSSGRVALTRGSSEQIQITVVAGGSIAFVAFGDATVAAAVATGVPVLPGTYRVFSIAPDVSHVAAITSTSTATLYATPGNGC